MTGNETASAALLRVTTLCIHSPDDDDVPYRLGRRLYESVASGKTFVEIHGSHNEGVLESIDIYIPALDKFITDIFCKEVI